VLEQLPNRHTPDRLHPRQVVGHRIVQADLPALGRLQDEGRRERLRDAGDGEWRIAIELRDAVQCHAARAGPSDAAVDRHAERQGVQAQVGTRPVQRSTEIRRGTTLHLAQFDRPGRAGVLGRPVRERRLRISGDRQDR
jgi:hypothetical protein